jgi:hypothetical protein
VAGGVARGTQLRGVSQTRMRHFATSEKVAGSIPNEVTRFFN